MSSSVAASLWVAFGVGLLVGLWAEEAEGAEAPSRNSTVTQFLI